MNAKFSFVLLVLVLFISACTPAITGNSAPVIDAAQPDETVALVPATGESTVEAERPEAEPRLWSGEIFLSDNDNPDVQLNNIQTEIQQDLQTGCMSEDDQPRRQSGCVE